MEAFKALNEVVKPELEDIFGKGLAATLVMHARNKAEAPIIGMNSQHFGGMVRAISDDPRFVNMVGSAKARDMKVKWLKLIAA